MKTYELLQELSNKSESEIQWCLLNLMLRDKIKFVDLNKAYVESLQIIAERNSDKYGNALTALASVVMATPKAARKSKAGAKAFNSAIFILDKSGKFNTGFRSYCENFDALTIKDCIATAYQYLYEQDLQK